MDSDDEKSIANTEGSEYNDDDNESLGSQKYSDTDNNATVFVKTEDNIVDSYKIAEMELSAKKIPFIIKRPLPGGACEYWKVKDLEILGF